MARGQEPKWTPGDPTKYIESKPKYLKYNGLGTKSFFPINPEIPSIDGNNPWHWEKVHSYIRRPIIRETYSLLICQFRELGTSKKRLDFTARVHITKGKGSLRNVSRKGFRCWLFAITILESIAVVAELAMRLVEWT